MGKQNKRNAAAKTSSVVEQNRPADDVVNVNSDEWPDDDSGWDEEAAAEATAEKLDKPEEPSGAPSKADALIDNITAVLTSSKNEQGYFRCAICGSEEIKEYHSYCAICGRRVAFVTTKVRKG